MNHDRHRHQPCPIATTAYWSYRPEYGVPVRITVGRPKRFAHPYLFAPALAPWSSFSKYRDADTATQRESYERQLDRDRDKIVAWFETFARDHPGETAVLLCFENVLAGQQCHRRWFAEWVDERLGWGVPEIGGP